MDDNYLGKSIRESRKMKGLTQEELAKIVNLSTMSIRRYESGERKPNAEIMLNIMNAIGEPYTIVSRSMMNEIKKKKDLEIRDTINLCSRIIEEEKNRPSAPLILSYEFLHDQNTLRLLFAFNHLNDEGKRIAVERIQELELISKYQSKNCTGRAETAPESREATPQGNDTPTNEKPPEGQIRPSDDK